jgi:hypothetical protein
MKFIILFIFPMLCSLGSCIVEKNSFIARPDKKNIVNKSVRMEGNYIAIVENPNNKTKGVAIFCLYNNGIALQYYMSIDTLSYGMANQLNDKRIFEYIAFTDSVYKNVKQAGGFKIDGNKIDIQIFEFVNYGSFELCTYKGAVINSTTIHIESCFIKSKSNFCPSNFDLKFTQMLKPDSTNQLMKKKWYWAN